MPSFKYRANDFELMDDLNSSGGTIERALVELEYVNKLLGGYRPVKVGVELLLSHVIAVGKPIHILDVGCGGGDVLRHLDSWSKRKGINLNLHGTDANPNVVDYAQTHSPSYIDYIAADAFEEEGYLEVQPDIIIATLFNHHFTLAENQQLLKLWLKHSKVGVVLNDLQRGAIPYYSIKLLTALLSKSVMVKNDAPLSVARGFKHNEIKSLLEQSGASKHYLYWKWAFRWLGVLVK